jgi:hypothetical protein
MAVELARTSAPFHHGALLVQLGGIRVCATHLSPHDAAHRLSEAREILTFERAAPRRGFVLLGDLNTLSPLDADEHDANNLAARLGVDDGLARKFLVRGGGGTASAGSAGGSADGRDGDDVGATAGATSWLFGGGGTDTRATTAPTEWAIDYAPMQALIDGGLFDVGHATSVSAAAIGSLSASASSMEAEAADGNDVSSESDGEDDAVVGLQNHSVPTLINADYMHATAMRLDYALVSPPLAERCVVSSWLTRDADTEKLSDHYPLLTDLDCEAW